MNEYDPSASLDTVIQTAMKRWTVPGLAIGLWHGQGEDLRAYGLASLETRCPLRTDTILQIGSISKVFTTTVLMTIVDEGLLALDDPVTRHMPNLRLTTANTGGEIRIRDLVTHTSGIYGDYFQDFGWGDDALEHYVDSMSDLRQVYEPGTLWSYSNSGFCLAGRIIETKLGMTFEEAVRKRIFDPLGMDRTFYFPHEIIAYPVSVGHMLIDPKGDEHEVARRWPIPRAIGPAGSISSTVGDMLRFARFHMGDGAWDGKRILSESSIQAMQEVWIEDPQGADAWGLGWQIDLFDGEKVLGHGGGTNGFNAKLDVVPSRHFALVVLTNSGRGSAAYREIISWVFKEFLGFSKPKTEPGAFTLEPGELAEYAGIYSQPLDDITLTVDGNGLRMDVVTKNPLFDTAEGREMPPVHLEPMSQDVFYATDGARSGFKVDFVRHDDASIRFLRAGGRVSDRVG